MKVEPKSIVPLLSVPPLLLASLVFAAAGCQVFPSTAELETDEIAAFYFVNASADETVVSAAFFRWTKFPECSALTFDDCGGEGTDEPLQVVDDRVTVTLVGDTHELGRDPSSAEIPVYSTSIAAAGTDDEIVFTLERADGVVLETSMTVPPIPVIAELPDTFSRRDGFTLVAEEDFGDDRLSGSFALPACFSGYSSEEEAGRLSFLFEGETSDATCDVSLTIARSRTGPGNPSFAQADIEVQRAMEPVTIRSTP